MLEVSVDYETRSAVDLRKAGVYVYAAHPSTDIWCFTFNDPLTGEFITWTPSDRRGEAQLRMYAEDPDTLFRAHNAAFERIIWREIQVKRYGFPDIPLERWRCTAAECAALALPRSLENAALVVGAQEQKDKEGHNLMMRMARPRKVIETEAGPIYEWWDVPEKMERLIAYNVQDVKTEMAVKTRVRDLTEQELRVYQLDQRINDRGVMLDYPLAVAVRDLAAEVQANAKLEMAAISKGAITSPTKVADIKAFLALEGTDVDSLNKDAVRGLLATGDLSAAVRRVLEIRSEAGKTSVKKVNAMFHCVGDDSRMRGLLLYHGAGTGRWSGKLIQPQNLPARSKALGDEFHAADWTEQVLGRRSDEIELVYPLLEVLAMQLRPCLRARDGYKLIGADFAAIEARVLAWLAGEEWLLKAFREGKDAYKVMAADIYRVPADSIGKPSAERDMGKRVLLGCGFGMGWKKFILTCLKDDVVIGDQMAQLIIDTYREKNSRVKALWYELERAAVAAVENPGQNYFAAGGKLLFTKRGDYLWVRLPNGKRMLAYYKPTIVEKTTPWGSKAKAVRFWGEDSTTRRWQRMDMYGGLIAENVTQATARDLMVDAMFRLEEAGYTILLSVHDEVIAEVPEFFGCIADFERIMGITEPWAEGCPVKAEGWEGPRYAK